MNIPIVTILGLIFITLKLIGYIDWSWVWVLSPFWIGGILFILWWLVVFYIIGSVRRVRRVR